MTDSPADSSSEPNPVDALADEYLERKRILAAIWSLKNFLEQKLLVQQLINIGYRELTFS